MVSVLSIPGTMPDYTGLSTRNFTGLDRIRAFRGQIAQPPSPLNQFRRQDPSTNSSEEFLPRIRCSPDWTAPPSIKGTGPGITPKSGILIAPTRGDYSVLHLRP